MGSVTQLLTQELLRLPTAVFGFEPMALPSEEEEMPVTAPIVLLTNRTTDGSPGGVAWGGGPGMISVYGTWNSGTTAVQIAYSADGGSTYINSDGVLITGADGTILVSYPPGMVRATVSNAGAGSNLNAKLESTR